MLEVFSKERPKIVVNHAQAGVRYSLSNPPALPNKRGWIWKYLENCIKYDVENLIYASSSSVYGGNKSLPYKETQSVDHPLVYTLHKKANEMMAHTYSHNYQLPATGLRFFTVYGPWGRPDMALYFLLKLSLEENLSM